MTIEGYATSFILFPISQVLVRLCNNRCCKVWLRGDEGRTYSRFGMMRNTCGDGECPPYHNRSCRMPDNTTLTNVDAFAGEIFFKCVYVCTSVKRNGRVVSDAFGSKASRPVGDIFAL